VSGEIVDLVFALRGKAVALDYADLLWQALEPRLPWFGDEPAAGVHPLAGVSPGDRELYLTHRARLALRLPAERVKAARALCGSRLDLGGEVEIGEAAVRPLSQIPTLYSSFVTIGVESEDEFIAACSAHFRASSIAAELVCGKARVGHGAAGHWHGYSLMLFGLSIENSLRMQREGLGGERKRGCGIFIPHKSVAAVGG
jgi:CRISPR-associated protein Cas6